MPRLELSERDHHCRTQVHSMQDGDGSHNRAIQARPVKGRPLFLSGSLHIPKRQRCEGIKYPPRLALLKVMLDYLTVDHRD